MDADQRAFEQLDLCCVFRRWRPIGSLDWFWRHLHLGGFGRNLDFE
jgi:hypothetical protein